MNKKFYTNMFTERMQKNKELNRVKTHQKAYIILALDSEESEEPNVLLTF